MTRFIDEYLPACAPGYPCYSSPRWNTALVQVDSQVEQANQRWAHPLHRFTIPEAVRDMDVFHAVRNHWLVMKGPYHIWPWRDPLDFASVQLDKPNVAPVITADDEELGVGDGFETAFQLYRTYFVGANQYRRRIEIPILSSVLIGFVPPSDNPGYMLPSYAVSRPGGVVTFSAPVAAETILTAGFLFDVPVRFESDDAFDGILRSLHVAGYADLTFIEARVC